MRMLQLKIFFRIGIDVEENTDYMRVGDDLNNDFQNENVTVENNFQNKNEKIPHSCQVATPQMPPWKDLLSQKENNHLQALTKTRQKIGKETNLKN